MYRLIGILLIVITLLPTTQAQAFSPYPPAAWYPPPAAANHPAYYVRVPQQPSLAFARPYYGYGAPRMISPAPAPTAQQPAAAVVSSPSKSKPLTKSPQARPTTPDKDAKTSNQAFLDRLRPLIEQENRRLRALRIKVRDQIDQAAAAGNLDAKQSAQLESLARKYRVDGDVLSDPAAQRELLRKIDEIPVSLALAQAANESAWGKSRFAREGNNLFGIWTYDESKGMVPRNRAPGKKHLVRIFDSEADSIRYYMFTLNSHPAYLELRRIRAQLRTRGETLDSLALAKGLLAYSAKGEEYVRLIRQMIQRFELAAYDTRIADNA